MFYCYRRTVSHCRIIQQFSNWALEHGERSQVEWLNKKNKKKKHRNNKSQGVPAGSLHSLESEENTKGSIKRFGIPSPCEVLALNMLIHLCPLDIYLTIVKTENFHLFKAEFHSWPLIKLTKPLRFHHFTALVKEFSRHSITKSKSHSCHSNPPWQLVIGCRCIQAVQLHWLLEMFACVIKCNVADVKLSSSQKCFIQMQTAGVAVGLTLQT